MSEPSIRNMAEFAALSGISRPTVAKYFDDPLSVRASTRAQIEQALQKYDYRPNLFAVNLNKRKPKILGMIVPDTADMVFAELTRQVEARCHAAGYLLLTLSSRGEPALEARAVETLLSLNIAGAIVAPLGTASPSTLLHGLGARMPTVFLDSRLGDDTLFVGTDNRQSMGLITDYLCRTGEPPSYFDMPPVNRNAVERRDAYLAVMARFGAAPHVVPSAPDPAWSFEEIACRQALRLLDGPGFPTRTVLCANDRMAMGVLSAAFRRGLKVGREADCALRVAGHDDHPLSRYACPPLTTVAQDFGGLAGTALRELTERIEAGGSGRAGPRRGEDIRLDATLVVRASA